MQLCYGDELHFEANEVNTLSQQHYILRDARRISRAITGWIYEYEFSWQCISLWFHYCMLEIVIFYPIMPYFMFQFLKKKTNRVSRKRQTLVLNPQYRLHLTRPPSVSSKLHFILFKFPLHSPAGGNINLHRLWNHHVVSVYVHLSISGG